MDRGDRPGHEVPERPDGAPAAPGGRIGDDEWQDLARRGRRAGLQMGLRAVALRGATFVGVLVLARVLAPADFGVYGVFAFFVSLLALLGDFGLGAVLVQQTDDPSDAEISTAWSAQLGMAIVSVAAVWLAAPALALLIPGLPADGDAMLRVLSLGLLLSAARTVPSVLMERELRFGPIALAEVAQQLAFYGVAVPLAFGGLHAWSFVYAGLAQLGVSALVVNLAAPRRPRLAIDVACLRRQLAFGLDFQVSQLAVWLRDAPVPAVTAAVLGTADAGLLQFAYRLALTLASVDEMISRIAFPAFSRLQLDGVRQGRALDAANRLTALVLVPVQCWIAVVAPVLVPAVFGATWRGAVLPLQLICLGTLLRFPTRYVRQAVFARGASGLGLAIAIVATATAIAPLPAMLAVWGVAGGGVAFLAGAAVALVATAALARSVVSVSWHSLGGIATAGVAASVAAAVVALAASGLPDAAAALLASAAFASVFAAALWWLDRSLVRLGWRTAREAIGV